VGGDIIGYGCRFGFMVFNATFNNNSVISWRSDLLVVETLTSCFGLMTDSALYQIDVPALSYIYAAYGKSGLISNGKE
jgi:hypothetical protein